MQAHSRQRQPAPGDEAGQLSIAISGDRETVTRLLASIAGTLAGGEPQIAPEPLYVLRDEAARLTGIPRDKLSNLIKLGQLTNYGSPAKLRFSLAEIRAWQESQR